MSLGKRHLKEEASEGMNASSSASWGKIAALSPSAQAAKERIINRHEAARIQGAVDNISMESKSVQAQLGVREQGQICMCAFVLFMCMRTCRVKAAYPTGRAPVNLFVFLCACF
jgi:hypothetical protein